MFNEDIKRQFMAENGQSDRAWVFERVSQHESALDKDLAEFNREEAIYAVSLVAPAELGTASHYVNLFRSYAEWYKRRFDKSAVYSGGFADITAHDIDFSASLSGILFKDESDLLDSMALVYPFDEGYEAVPVLVLAWLGLSRDEVSALRDNGVNLETRTITAPNGDTLASGFSDALAEVLMLYRNCKVAERGTGLHVMEVRRDESVDSFLKRMLPAESSKFGTEFSKLQITGQIDKFARRYEEKGFPRRHTFTNVWRSGRLHALWELEQTGVDVTARANRPLVEQVMKNRKNYYNAVKLYQTYKKIFKL